MQSGSNLGWWACEPEEAFEHPFTRVVGATRGGDISAVGQALLADPSAAAPSRPLPSSVNPLPIEAVLHRELDILEMLLDRSSESIAAVDTATGASLLHLASALGDTGIAGALLARQSDLVRAQDAYGLTPAHYAAHAGRKAVISLLLSSGADVNARAAASGATPLIYAAARGHGHCMECLLAAGADPAAADASGRTALHWVAFSGAVPAAEAVLGAAGARVTSLIDVQDEEGETALLVASRRGADGIVEVLLSRSALVDAVNRHGVTGLMAASLFGHSNVVQSLLAANANVAVADPIHGRTSLHLAAMGGAPEVMAALVAAGAARDARDAEGRTPEDLLG
jgi:ankyrin repeat protein